MKTFQYYFNYTDNEIDYLFNSASLTNREKNLLKDLTNGLTMEKMANKYKCSTRTICRIRKKLFFKTKDVLKQINVIYGDNIKQPPNIKNRGNQKYNNLHLSEYCVYILIFPNNKVYIGQTLNPSTRWCGNGIGYKMNKEMYNDIIEYGWKNITKKVIFRNLTLEESLEKEKEMIIHYKSNIPIYGYNKSFN